MEPNRKTTTHKLKKENKIKIKTEVNFSLTLVYGESILNMIQNLEVMKKRHGKFINRTCFKN